MIPTPKHPHTRRRPARRSRGYVLVVTLGLLVLAASLMVAVGRGAMRHTTAARLAADELQHRWGVVSCEAAVLPYVEAVLLTVEAERHAAAPVYRESVQLGAERFELTVSDELAKANVNQLLDHTDRPTAEARLRQGLTGTGLSMNVRLRPSANPLAGPASQPTTAPTTQPSAEPLGLPQWISGFGQIFEDASPDRLLEFHGGASVAQLLTCWGGGPINIRRISPDALKLAAGGALSGIDQNRLLAMRDLLLQGKPLPAPAKGPPDNDLIARLIQASGVDQKSLSKAPRFMARSTCFSIWITSHDGRRAWHYFSVRDTAEKDHPRTSAFVW